MNAVTYYSGRDETFAIAPQTRAAVIVLAHAVFWTLYPGLLHTSPPVDTLEVYMWAREWIVVSNKHPNMAGWLLAASHAVIGAYGWSAYMLAQVCTTIAILFMYLLGRDIASAEIGARGAILACTLGYLSWFTPQYNPNVVSLPFWAGFIWALWQVRRRGSLTHWLVIGLIAAGLVYCKLSGLVLVGLAAGYSLIDPRLREQLTTPGPWLAMVLFLLLLLPGALEIYKQDFMLFKYAASKAKGPSNAIQFLAGQILMCSVMLGVMAITYRRIRKARGVFSEGCRFVTMFTLVPMMVLVAQSVIFSTRLHDLWTLPMGSILGLAAAMHAERLGYVANDRLQRMLVLAVVVTAPAIYGIAKTHDWLNDNIPPPTSWPQRQAAQVLENLWNAKTGAPLRLVAGDTVEGGMIALTSSQRPSLIIDMDIRRTPWIDPAGVKKFGLLAVWPIDFKDGDQAKSALTRACLPKPVAISWPREPRREPFVMHYCIIPPSL